MHRDGTTGCVSNAEFIPISTIDRHRWTRGFGGVQFRSCSAVKQHRVAGGRPARRTPGVEPALSGAGVGPKGSAGSGNTFRRSVATSIEHGSPSRRRQRATAADLKVRNVPGEQQPRSASEWRGCPPRNRPLAHLGATQGTSLRKEAFVFNQGISIPSRGSRREAAMERSPRPQPWGNRAKRIRAPEGRWKPAQWLFLRPSGAPASPQRKTHG